MIKIQRPLIAWCASATALAIPSVSLAAPAVPAAGDVPAAPANTAVPAVPASSAAATQFGSLTTAPQLETEITLFSQINGLNLGQPQIQDIVSRLTRLAQADGIVSAHKMAALKPVMAQLARVHKALLAGDAPAAADQAAIDAATAPLKTEELQIALLRQDTAAGIRQDLSTDQVNLVLADLGMQSPQAAVQAAAANTAPAAPVDNGAGGQPTGAVVQGGPAPGFVGPGGAAAGGAPGGGGPGAGGPGGGGGFGGRGGGRNGAAATPQGMMGWVLNRFRRMPQDQFDQMKDQIGQGMAQRFGMDPNSPQFKNISGNFMNQVNLARGLTDDEWKQQRDQISSNLVTQIQAGGVNLQQIMTGGLGGRGGRTAQALAEAESTVDNDAIQKFFLRADTLSFLQSKLAHQAPAQ